MTTLLVLSPSLLPTAPLRRNTMRHRCDIRWDGARTRSDAEHAESIEDAAEGLKLLKIAPPAGMTDSFTIGGQYLQIREPGAEKAGIFAISSAPGKKGSFEFLVKEQPPVGLVAGHGLADGRRGRPQARDVAGDGSGLPGRRLAGLHGAHVRRLGDRADPLGDRERRAPGQDGAAVLRPQTPLQMSYQDKFKEWFTKYQVRVTP